MTVKEIKRRRGAGSCPFPSSASVNGSKANLQEIISRLNSKEAPLISEYWRFPLLLLLFLFILAGVKTAALRFSETLASEKAILHLVMGRVLAGHPHDPLTGAQAPRPLTAHSANCLRRDQQTRFPRSRAGNTPSTFRAAQRKVEGKGRMCVRVCVCECLARWGWGGH